MAKKVIRRSKGTAPKVEGPKAKTRAPKEAPVKVKSTRVSKSKRMNEKALKAKYPGVIVGTLVHDEITGKQHVEILCAKKGCKVERIVATSDLFQVRYCPEHTLTERRARRAEVAKARKAATSA